MTKLLLVYALCCGTNLQKIPSLVLRVSIYSYGCNFERISVWFPAGTHGSLLHHHVHISSGTYTAYQMHTEGAVRGDKSVWACRWPLLSIAKAKTRWSYTATLPYKACSKKDRTFAMKTSLLILQHFKHCPLQSSPLYWQYTVPNISSIVAMLPGTHFLWWCAVLLSHFPESHLCH
jgi:hypothetical protein